MPMNPKLLRPKASGAFNPASIAGLTHWWDANDSATLTLNSGAVEAWASKAGAKISATQTTANNRPTTTSVNGKTALLFDGSNDGFSFAGTSRTDETWIVAAAQNVGTGTQAILNDAGNGHGILASAASVKLIEAGFGGGFVEGVNRLRVQYHPTSAQPAGPLVVSVVRSAAAGGFVFIDGTQRVSAINGASSFTSSQATTLQRIGFYSSTLWPWNGWIGEILLYDRALSASERSKVEKYLGKKWGITVA